MKTKKELVKRMMGEFIMQVIGVNLTLLFIEWLVNEWTDA